MKYLLPFLLIISQAYSQFHKKLEVGDLVHYFGSQKPHQVPEYELIPSTDINKISNNTDLSAEYEFTVFGSQYHLYLEPNYQLLSPACIVQKVGANNTHLLESCAQEKEYCHHHGYLKNSNQSFAAISTCNGLHGIISTENHDLVIQPVKLHHVFLTGLSTESHLVFKRSPTRSKWSPTDQIKASMGEETHLRGKRSAGQYLEVKAVVAPDVASYHGDDTRRFVTTVLNIAAQRFQDTSLGYKLDLTLVEMMILKDENELSIVADTPTLLDSFCKWQQKYHPADDSDPRHADHVLLITRKDLADHGDDTNVGLSYTGQICSQQYKCSVNEDSGVQTGLTIAHEIGHSLGMKHDGDGNDCKSNAYIMASNSAGRLQWSRCSAMYLEDFLSSSQSSCLNDSSAGRSTTHLYTDHKPGMYYSYNKQCQLAKDPEAYKCAEEVNCSKIRCRSGPHCYELGMPMIDGTECGNRKWCIEGECVPMGTNAPGPLNGGWSSWSDIWSECSRTCGGGVKTRTRSCSNPEPRYGGRDCSGDAVMAKLCNVQECSSSQYRYKEEQCAATNGELYNGTQYNWLPMSSASEKHACQLICRWSGVLLGVPRGSMKYHDGTSCIGQSHTGRCINGRCWDFGCDGHLKSGLTFDKCGICNGRGDSCREHKGTYNQGTANKYVTFVKIPKGATGIVVTNLNRFCHLSISVRGERMFSEGTSLSRSGSYSTYGVLVKYRRQGPEKIEITGPLSEEIEAQVYREYSTDYMGTNPQVTYVYHLPNSVSHSEYKWLSTPGPCTQTCGQGHSIPEVTCVKISDNQRVDDFHCNLYTKPTEVPESCNGNPCPPQWSVGNWETCSRSCGGGVTHRSVQCAVLQHGSPTPVADSHCSGQRKPQTSKSCNEEACLGVWKADTWSCCSRICGKGVRTRQVRCYASQGSTTPVSNGNCYANHKPASEEICMEKPCDTTIRGSSCHDNEDCSAYSSTVCTDSQYSSFARENCKEYCGYCVKDPQNFQPPVSDDCKDKVDCSAYGDDVCSEYREWAKANCQKTCGLCVNQCLLRTEPQQTTQSGSCRDEKNDCAEYGSDMCTSYVVWAKHNCQKTCNLCPVVTTTPVTSSKCSDKKNDCAEYGTNMCKDYGEWAAINCQKHCNLCPAETSVVVTTTPVTSSKCTDKKNDCAEYGTNMCKDYGEWAAINCQKHCNLCPAETSDDKSCVDKVTDCAEYTKSVCTDYKAWAEQNCQNYCGLCGSRRKRSLVSLMSEEPFPKSIYGEPQKKVNHTIKVPPKPTPRKFSKDMTARIDNILMPLKLKEVNDRKDIPVLQKKNSIEDILNADVKSLKARSETDNSGKPDLITHGIPVSAEDEGDNSDLTEPDFLTLTKVDAMDDVEDGPQWQLVHEDVQPIPIDDNDQPEQVDPPFTNDLDIELDSLSASQRVDKR